MRWLARCRAWWRRWWARTEPRWETPRWNWDDPTLVDRLRNVIDPNKSKEKTRG